MSLVTRQYGPDAKGLKLTNLDMDNNLYYLQSIGVSGFSFSSNTITITNPTGGTESVLINNLTGLTINGDLTVTGNTNINSISATTISATTYQNLPDNVTGKYLPLSGGTVSGSTQFTNGLTANTISATTYQNLPTDIKVTGGTYTNGTATFTNNTGGTFNVTGFFTGGTDVFVTGGTFSSGTATFRNNTGGTFSVSGFSTGSSFTGGTVSGSTQFTNGLTATTISATTYYNVSTNFQYEIHVSQVDGNDTTGNGDLLNPVASITKALTLITGQRRTIVIHPGSYTESPSITTQYTVLTTYEPLGGNTAIVGTVSTSVGCTIAGLTIQNITITTGAGVGVPNIINCNISGTLTKSGNATFTDIHNCNIDTACNITGTGLVTINDGNPNFVTVNNAGANVIIKNAMSCVSPSVTAGTLNITESIVIAAVTNAVTSSAGSVITLGNSQFLTSALNNVAPVSLSGFYSIFNCVFDKPNSTLVTLSGTGGPTNSIDYFQYINADKFITQGGTSSQYVMGDGSLSNGFTGGTVSGSTIFTNGLTANTISATTYQNLPLDIRVTGGTYSAGTITLLNNTGGTVSISGLSTGYTYSQTNNYTSGIPITITHNLNTTEILIQIIDTNTNQLILGSVSNYQLNSVDVTLSSSLNGIKVVIVGGSVSSVTPRGKINLLFGHDSVNPLDSTTYYIGGQFNLPPITSANDGRRLISPVTGFITQVSISETVSSTLGSSEPSTFTINNVTQSTSSTITTTATYDSSSSLQNYILSSSLYVVNGDRLEIRWITPVWGPNPISVRQQINVLIDF